MTPSKRLSALMHGGMCALALAALTPTAAWAQAKECNGFINISYPGFPPTPLEVPPPKEFDVQINLGTGTITGGTLGNVLLVDSFDVQLACNADFPLIPTCTPDGPPGFPPQKIEFVGMIQDQCGGSTFTPSIGGVGNNVLTLTANPTVVIPKEVPPIPGFCAVQFRLRAVQGFSSDMITPGEIEETVNYALALCDNGVLVSAGGQTASVPVTSPGNPFIAYQIKQQGVMIDTGGAIDIPALGLVAAPIDAMVRATARRLLTPGLPANVNGDHLLAFEAKRQGQSGGGFPLPPQNGRMVTVSTKEFGQVTRSLEGPWMAMINARKDLQNPVPPQPLTDVYACYKIDGPRGGRLDWQDQFGPATGTLKGNQSICFPASLKGTTPPDFALFCVNASWSKRPPGYTSKQLVFLGSAWLTDDERLEGVDEYCAAVTQLTVAP